MGMAWGVAVEVVVEGEVSLEQRSRLLKMEEMTRAR
jgi:predicted HTH domain antitoxin